jgi:hypothetical protein
MVADLPGVCHDTVPLQDADDHILIARSIGSRGAAQIQAALNNAFRHFRNWRMSISEPKSCVLLIHAANRSPPVLRFTLNGFTLKQVASLTYLGVLIDQHLSFRPQLSAFKAKAGRLKGYLKVCLTAGLKGAAVPFPVALAVVRSLLLPSLLYAAEFWVQQQTPVLNLLDRAAADLLNCSLQLPKSAPPRGILAECGLPCAQEQVEARILSRASSICGIEKDSPAKVLLNLELSAPIPPRRARPLTLGRMAIDAKQAWGIFIPASKDIVKANKIRIAHARFCRDPVPKKLVNCLRAPGRPLYLTREGACPNVRAAFRFNLLRTRAMHDKWHLLEQAFGYCDHCPGVRQTTRHLLLECSRHATLRHTVLSDLQVFGIDCSIGILCGVVEALEPHLRSLCLRITLPLLKEIHASLSTG